MKSEGKGPQQIIIFLSCLEYVMLVAYIDLERQHSTCS